MKITRIGMDIAKSVFQLHGVDSHDRAALKKKLKRSEVLAFYRTTPACEVGIEACGGAHHWAREIGKLGHSVKLIAPQFVKPYVKTNKNDAADAEAICEAMSRPNMRFVPIKTTAQQDLQAIHRIRSELIKQRTMKGNQIRGLLAEYGVVVDKRLERLRAALPVILEQVDSGDGGDNGLTMPMRHLLAELREDLVKFDERVKQMDEKIALEAKGNDAVKRLQQIPGIGPVSATALVAAVGDAKNFKCGRAMAAWLGLVPAQKSSGGKDRLLGISKRGDSYLRTLLIHGARASQRAAINKTDPRSVWVNALGERRHKNVAAVALANKNARIAWAILSRGEDYRGPGVSTSTSGTTTSARNTTTSALPTAAHEASVM